MIQFNVTPARAADHAATESLRDRTAKWWTCADAKLEQFGDLALAVEANVVTGVFTITGWTRDPEHDNKVVLDLVDLPADHPAMTWIGQEAPLPWTPGQRQPFKYVVRADISPAAARFVHSPDTDNFATKTDVDVVRDALSYLGFDKSRLRPRLLPTPAPAAPTDTPAAIPSDDRRSRTLTAGDLIALLSEVDPALPVVFEGIDEPLGCYGVRAASVEDGWARENTFAGKPCGWDVFHGPIGGRSYQPHDPSYDQPGAVVFLHSELREQSDVRE